MKEKLDAIFKAFESYIKGQDYFDIVYSKKYGYVRLVVDSEEMELLDTPEKMLDYLCYDVISEVVYSADNPKKEHDGFELTEYEETESRRRLTAILEKMEGEDGARYLSSIDGYLERYQRSSALDDDE
ncbi:MAG: hypothetical protein HFE45_01590 [Oscillospiraceae bacterium]|nr:hypothetical protein [Oscillospiraceae bacterium]